MDRCAQIPGRRFGCWLLSVAAAAALAPGTDGQVTRPESAQRVVRAFDFEERALTLEEVPQHWVRWVHLPPRFERPGYPRWNASSFDDAHAVSGDYSVKLPTKGGSTALVLASDVVLAFPGADYRVLAQARTEGLEHARGRMTIRYLDRNQQPIPGAEASSDLIISDGEWTPVHVDLIGEHEGADSIQVALELLQKEQHMTREKAAHETWLEDVNGAIWFDDVVIQQIPRVTIRSNRAANLIVAPETPSLHTTVQDLTGESLRCRIEVRDVDGRLVTHTEFAAPSLGREVEWIPELTQYGWYDGRLTIFNDRGVVGERNVHFAWVPERRRDFVASGAHFGVSVDEILPAHRDHIPLLLSQINSGALHYSVWNRDLTLDGIGEFVEGIRGLVSELLEEGHRITFVLSRAPDEMIRSVHIQEHELFQLLEKDRQDWLPYLSRIVDRFGQSVRRWQIGSTPDPTFLRSPEIDLRLAMMEEILQTMAPEPIVVTPWSAMQQLDPEASLAHAHTVKVPSMFHASALETLRDDWPEDLDATLLLELPDPDVFGRRAATIELVKRIIQLWRSGAAQIIIERPWTISEDRIHQMMPAPVLPVYRTVIERITGRTIVGQFPTPEGCYAFILDGPGDDAIVAWNETADPDSAWIRAYLADGPVTLIEPFGNSRQVYSVDGLHEVQIGLTPIFIEGVDVNLARFRSGFRVEPSFVASTASRHDMHLVLTNPWSTPITGRLRINEPADWNVSPRVQSFSVAPGATRRLPFESAFGVGEEAGARTIEVEFDLSADRRYPIVLLEDDIELGLEELQLTPSYHFLRDEGGVFRDLAVSLLITNIGDEPVTLHAFAQAPGYAREQAPISDLPPNQSTMKRFVFPGGATTLRGRSLRVGLVHAHDLGRLNQTLKID